MPLLSARLKAAADAYTFTDVQADHTISVTFKEKKTEPPTEPETSPTPSVEKPVITKQPVNVSVKEGETAVFTVTADGTELSYQWQIDRNDGKGFVDLANAAGVSYTTSVVDTDCNGFQYRCIITNRAGSVTSGTADLTVTKKEKTIPYVKTAPVLSGTYGNMVSAMFEKADMTKAVVTAVLNSDTKVEGTWTLASEDADKIPTVGASDKYTLVFTPTGSDADTYDSVTCEVTPVVSKKKITVVIADKEKFYGETNPALTWSLATGAAYSDNVLVAGDTEEALGISLSTTAKDNSSVETYVITGLSDSANYEVSFTGSGSDGKSGILTVKQAANR